MPLLEARSLTKSFPGVRALKGTVKGDSLMFDLATSGESTVVLSFLGVIVDADDRVIGIAGVMGGASTEISASTTDVVLELAWWDPAAIQSWPCRRGGSARCGKS